MSKHVEGLPPRFPAGKQRYVPPSSPVENPRMAVRAYQTGWSNHPCCYSCAYTSKASPVASHSAAARTQGGRCARLMSTLWWRGGLGGSGRTAAQVEVVEVEELRIQSSFNMSCTLFVIPEDEIAVDKM